MSCPPNDRPKPANSCHLLPSAANSFQLPPGLLPASASDFQVGCHLLPTSTNCCQNICQLAPTTANPIIFDQRTYWAVSFLALPFSTLPTCPPHCLNSLNVNGGAGNKPETLPLPQGHFPESSLIRGQKACPLLTKRLALTDGLIHSQRRISGTTTKRSSPVIGPVRSS